RHRLRHAPVPRPHQSGPEPAGLLSGAQLVLRRAAPPARAVRLFDGPQRRLSPVVRSRPDARRPCGGGRCRLGPCVSDRPHPPPLRPAQGVAFDKGALSSNPPPEGKPNDMNLDLYSDRAKQAVQSAQSLALARRHQQFAPEHLLKVLLEERDGLARKLIDQAGGDPSAVELVTEGLLKKRPQVEGGSGQLYLDGDTARVFSAAEEAAKKAGDAFVTTERLLAAIAKEGGAAAEALKSAGVTAKKLDE